MNKDDTVVDYRLTYIYRHWNGLNERARRSLYDLAVCQYEWLEADRAARNKRNSFEVID